MALSKSDEAQSLWAFATGILKMGAISVSSERMVTFLIGLLLLSPVPWREKSEFKKLCSHQVIMRH
jgi:hypothetical protein